MDVTVARLADDPLLDGTVVVIDAVRAFVTSAALFDAGADEIHCVETLEQARELRGDDTLLVGEHEGWKPADFDHGNSPRDLPGVTGRRVVQRTSNGTRGLVRALAADAVLAMAATNLSATARWLLREHPAQVTALCTGRTSEDLACSHALAALLRGDPFDAAQLRTAVLASGPEHAIWAEPWYRADVEACADVDRYDFAMVGARGGSGIVLRAARA